MTKNERFKLFRQIVDYLLLLSYVSLSKMDIQTRGHITTARNHIREIVNIHYGDAPIEAILNRLQHLDELTKASRQIVDYFILLDSIPITHMDVPQQRHIIIARNHIKQAVERCYEGDEPAQLTSGQQELRNTIKRNFVEVELCSSSPEK